MLGARILIQHTCIILLALKKNCLFYGLFRNETCFHYIEGTKRSHDKHENRMIYNISDILELKECTLFNMLKPFTSHKTKPYLLSFQFVAFWLKMFVNLSQNIDILPFTIEHKD